MNFGNTFTKVASFAKAVASRGITNKKTDVFTKKLRVISCFGDSCISGELPPCEHLKNSKAAGKFYCGGCGCGDRKATWLVSDAKEYSKLDYPNLSCPLKMPGFTDYEISSAEESISPITRRYYIEQLKDTHIDKVPVSDNEMPEDIKKKLEKALENNKSKPEND